MAVRRRGGSTCPPLLRKILIWSIVLFASLLLLGFISYARLLSYLQGEDFRDSLERLLAAKAQATSAEIDGTLVIDANRISLKGLSLQRPALPQRLRARNIHAELVRSELLDKKLHLTRLMVEEGSLNLNLDRKAPKRTQKSASSSRILSDFAPARVQLDQLDCKDFNISLSHAGKEYSLADSALSASPPSQANKHTWEFRMNSGHLHTPLPVIGDSSLKSATLYLNDKTAVLNDASLMLSPGELIVDAVREQGNGNWSADMRAIGVDVSRLIGEDWKRRISGELYGRLQADGNKEGLQLAKGKLFLQQGIAEALPFLENIPVGNSYPYRHLKLEKATARISYPHTDSARNINKAWLLDQIDIRAEGGYLLVQGHVLVDADGTLGGSLLIGLPEGIANSLLPEGSPLHQSLFNATGERGYHWLRLNLSGSLSAPQEDLSARLKTLLFDSAASALRNLLMPAQQKRPDADSPATTAPHPPSNHKEPAAKPAGDNKSARLRAFF